MLQMLAAEKETAVKIGTGPYFDTDIGTRSEGGNTWLNVCGPDSGEQSS